MKWMNSLKNISSGKEPGECPYCGSENTEYSATVIDQDTKMGYMDIWCNDCRRAFHMSRMKVEDGLRTEKEIPHNLKY